jgi:hypothetical protein
VKRWSSTVDGGGASRSVIRQSVPSVTGRCQAEEPRCNPENVIGKALRKNAAAAMGSQPPTPSRTTRSPPM